MKRSLGAKTIAQPAPVWVIGAFDKQGRPNVMTASWAGICCSRPPCLAVSLRSATYTYHAIVERKCFTVSIPGRSQAEAADYLGLESGACVDKFAKAGLTPEKSTLVEAPYVKEFPLVVECSLLQTVEIGLHTQFIGEILDVKADEEVIESDLPSIERVNPILFDPASRRYFAVGDFIGNGFSIGKAKA